MYKICVDGACIEPQTIQTSAHPFNRTWPGAQRDASQCEIAYMLRLFGKGKKRIDVEADFCISEAIVRPLSKDAKIAFDGHRASVTLEGHGKYSVEFNGHHHAIHVIYQEEMPVSSSAPTYSFGDGHHYVGLLRLHDGESVYLSKNAVVHGSLYAVDASHIRIYGNGILCGDWEERIEKHGDIGFDNENSFSPEDVHTYGGIRTYRCEDISVEGIIVTDTASYGISFFATDGIYIDNVTVLGLWKYNCDGIDFFNCSNMEVKNCFIRSFDDCMCMKGLTAFSDKNTMNARIEDCVFWCDWGKNIDIGLATACQEIKNIVWKNCDIIHGSGVCIAISNGQWADVHDVWIEDFRIEYSAYTEAPCIQKNDDEEYPVGRGTHIPDLLLITDRRRNWQGNVSLEDARTKIRDITISHINVMLDKRIEGMPRIQVKKTTDSSVFESIKIDDVFFNGERQTINVKF